MNDGGENRTVLAQERREHILRELQRAGKVVAAELSRALDVSDDTIRRDLDTLAAAGRLRRVYGGALPAPPLNADYMARQAERSEAKEAIACAAAALIRPGQVVLLDGGTTTLAVARHLPHDLRATIVTTSPPIAVELAGRTNLEIIMIGGRLYRYPLVNVGASAVAALRAIRADLCVVGVMAIHPEVGLSVVDYEEAAAKRAMIEGAADVVAPALAQKLGTVAPFVVCPTSAVTHLITERGVSDELLAPYRALGLTVIRG